MNLKLVDASAPERDPTDVGDGPAESVESGKAGTSTHDLYVQELEREARAQRRRIATLLKQLEGREDQRRETYAVAANEVYDYWRERCHPDAHALKAGSKRERKIIDRLSEGYSIEYCKRAIDGAKHDPHRSERGAAFDEFELIFRDEIKVESFHRRAPQQQATSEMWLGPRIDPLQ